MVARAAADVGQPRLAHGRHRRLPLRHQAERTLKGAKLEPIAVYTVCRLLEQKKEQNELLQARLAARDAAAAAVKLAPIALYDERRRREHSGKPAECQPAAREEPDAAPCAPAPPTTPQPPVLGTRTGTLPETPLLQPVQSLPEPEPPTVALERCAECQPATREELCASPRAPEPEPTTPAPVRARTGTLPATPLPQTPLPAELSSVFDEVASPELVANCASVPLESPVLPAAPSVLPPVPSVRALPFAPALERVRLRRRWVPLWPLPPAEAEVCEVNVCFSREAHGRKERRERPPRLRDKGEGEVREQRERGRKRKRIGGRFCVCFAGAGGGANRQPAGARKGFPGLVPGV